MIKQAHKEHPILFSTEMVKAILAGNKTQTRRIVKPQPEEGINISMLPRNEGFKYHAMTEGQAEDTAFYKSPFGLAGDLLWVRETWRYYDWCHEGMPWIECKATPGESIYISESEIPEEWIQRKEDIWIELSEKSNLDAHDGIARDPKWRPSIFMPRWASRITLKITGVRVERVQDISAEDAAKEGVWDSVISDYHGAYNSFDRLQCRRDFQILWDSINKDRGYGWDTNPWVWVYDFDQESDSKE